MDKTIVDWVNTYWFQGKGNYEEFEKEDPEMLSGLTYNLREYRLRYGRLPAGKDQLVRYCAWGTPPKF